MQVVEVIVSFSVAVDVAVAMTPERLTQNKTTDKMPISHTKDTILWQAFTSATLPTNALFPASTLLSNEAVSK